VGPNIWHACVRAIERLWSRRVNGGGGGPSADLGDSSHDTRGRLIVCFKQKENVLWADVGRGSGAMLDKPWLADPNSCFEKKGKGLLSNIVRARHEEREMTSYCHARAIQLHRFHKVGDKQIHKKRYFNDKDDRFSLHFLCKVKLAFSPFPKGGEKIITMELNLIREVCYLSWILINLVINQNKFYALLFHSSPSGDRGGKGGKENNFYCWEVCRISMKSWNRKKIKNFKLQRGKDSFFSLFEIFFIFYAVLKFCMGAVLRFRRIALVQNKYKSIVLKSASGTQDQ